jgi:hypothetical protein
MCAWRLIDAARDVERAHAGIIADDDRRDARTQPALYMRSSKTYD